MNILPWKFLLSWGAVKAYGGLVFLERVSQGDGCAHRCCAVYIVAAAVAEAARDDWLLAETTLVAYTGKGVILSHEADDGFPYTHSATIAVGIPATRASP